MPKSWTFVARGRQSLEELYAVGIAIIRVGCWLAHMGHIVLLVLLIVFATTQSQFLSMKLGGLAQQLIFLVRR